MPAASKACPLPIKHARCQSNIHAANQTYTLPIKHTRYQSTLLNEK
jgi:hypothetical protein